MDFDRQPSLVVEAIAPEFRRGLLAAIPALRKFAISLTGRSDLVDDLVQETLMRAWRNHAGFQPGTNLQAWLFTILKNEFYRVMRKRRREVEDVEGRHAHRVVVPPAQHGHIELAELNRAMDRITASQRDALELVVLSGNSYLQAAKICRVREGTMKSRLSRARARLAELMGVDGVDDFGPDAIVHAGISATGTARQTIHSD
jgi:RNA polymerase sigma-70 factor (ECF subfamily)